MPAKPLRTALGSLIIQKQYDYSDREPADKIYRNRKNLKYCKEHGIRLSGPALGRPKKDPTEDRKITYTDAVDRIGIERDFSLAKRCYGLGLILTKLDTTTRSSICLSIIAMNVDRLTAISLRDFLKSFFQSALVGYLDIPSSPNRRLTRYYCLKLTC